MQTLDRETQGLKTIRDFIRWSASQFNRHAVFFGHGSDNAWDEAAYLVLGALHLPWDIDPAALDSRVTEAERDHIVDLLGQRIEQRVPVPYLINEAWFAGLPFHVSRDVLIPRSPIAELIERGFQPWFVGDEVHRILDMCTGSGCIGIASAFQFPDAQVELSDISTAALAVTDKNISRHELSERVSAVHSDLFDNLTGQYDLIITNPPYVDANDLASMPAEYQHEPSLGLAAGEDGLDVIRNILRQAGDYLTEYGVLVAEVGNSWEALDAAFPEVPFLWVELEQGGHGVFVLTAGQLQQYKAAFG